MTGAVTRRTVAAQPTIVVAAGTTWAEFPALWRELLDEVWGRLRAAGITGGCPNVMLYLDDVPHVEVGVITSREVPLAGRVVRSSLPSGSIATIAHRGPYEELGAAHDAVRRWCAESGLPTAGPRWEIYGPHRNDPAEREVEVCYLLA